MDVAWRGDELIKVSHLNKYSWKLLTFDNNCQQKTKTEKGTLPVFVITVNETKVLFNTLSQPGPLVHHRRRQNETTDEGPNLSVCNSKTHFNPTYLLRANIQLFKLSFFFPLKTFCFFFYFYFSWICLGFIKFRSQGETCTSDMLNKFLILLSLLELT